MASGAKSLDELTFDNRFTSDLPADPIEGSQIRQVQGAAYSRVQPTATAGPTTASVSAEVAADLDLSDEALASQQFAEVFSGNAVLDGMDPHAMAYGGHQFGNWAGQLGDGRAIGLGDVLTDSGSHLSLQLKGAGETPYSRRADGRAVLRSSVREFLCSEAMFHLGVPTTRALSLVMTGDMVMRDMLYDGNPALEHGAVVCRVAPSFLRFGNYELPASRGDTELLRQLADYTIRNHFPYLLGDGQDPTVDTYLAWFREVVTRTAEMIAHWMRVGFVHGVMNTDNMSILGLTIDYGPYGWLEDYDPGWTPNTTDASGKRYRYGYQPQIAHWNLTQLANAVYPLIEQVEPLQAALDSYVETYEKAWGDTMAAKLGLNQVTPIADEPLLAELLRVLQLAETDMTIFYRRLATLPVDLVGGDQELIEPMRDSYYVPEQLTDDVVAQVADWVRSYQARVRLDGTPDDVRRKRMDAVNPKYVLRNYLAQLAIDQADEGDYSMIAELLDVLRHPYDEQPEYEHFAAKRPDWARSRVGCSMLSCSS